MKSFLWCILCVVFVLLLDQISKTEILHLFQGIEGVRPLFPGVNLVLTWNPGVSFGFLGGIVPPLVLSLGALTISLGLIIWMWFIPHGITRFAVAAVAGGALGNIIDRFRYDAVIDFIDVYITQWHWPAFNVADTFISLGVATLLWYNFLEKGEENK